MRLASITYTIALATASLVIMASFGLHAMQITHVHATTIPHHDTHEHKHTQNSAALGEYMHAADKKYLTLGVFLAATFCVFLEGVQNRWVMLLKGIHILVALTLKHTRVFLRYFNYFVDIFKTGVLHTQTH